MNDIGRRRESRQTVVVVDDSPLVRKLIRGIAAGIPQLSVVGEAEDGPGALRLIEVLQPDILSLDVEMPGMSGIEVLEEVRQQHPVVKTILVSSHTPAGADVTLRGLAMGAIDAVAKERAPAGGGESFRTRLVRALTAAFIARPPTAEAAAVNAQPTSPVRRPDVICVLASTGGPPAVEAFLTTFPQPPQAPIVIVQHMPETFTARFAQRLDGVGSLRVVEARSGMALETGTAIVARGDRHLRFRGGVARLDESAPVAGLRPRGDLTLKDLARDTGRGFAAVVLTGMGDDGLAGCLAVHSAGGQVMAQDSASAVVDSMPKMVRAAGLAHLTGTPTQLARAIAGPSRTADSRPRGKRLSITDGELRAVTRTLADRSDFDVSGVKKQQLIRWLGDFMQRNGIPTPRRLVDVLQEDADLRQALTERLTVNTTGFFRSPQSWHELEVLLPAMRRQARFWSAGCADGPEPYGLVMVALEAGLDPRTVATDVDEGSLAAARRGFYEAARLAPVPAAYRDRYFEPAAGGWQVRAEVQDRVTFRKHNALTGPDLPGLFDLIACRSVAIYFTSQAQRTLSQRLAGALRPGGVLFIGGVERIPDPTGLGLQQVGPFLYQKERT